MRGYVVYESFFGNTKQIAEAIAEGLSPAFEVDVAAVQHADLEPQAELVVIGGPTHMGGISRWLTRGGARRQARSEGREPPSEAGASARGSSTRRCRTVAGWRCSIPQCAALAACRWGRRRKGSRGASNGVATSCARRPRSST